MCGHSTAQVWTVPIWRTEAPPPTSAPTRPLPAPLAPPASLPPPFLNMQSLFHRTGELSPLPACRAAPLHAHSRRRGRIHPLAASLQPLSSLLLPRPLPGARSLAATSGLAASSRGVRCSPVRMSTAPRGAR
eukprot:351583-Chlamydomonas_euryale.AAC.8